MRLYNFKYQTNGNQLTWSYLAGVLGGIITLLVRAYQLFVSEWVLLRSLRVDENRVFSLCAWGMRLGRQWNGRLVL